MSSKTDSTFLRFRAFQIFWLIFILFHMAISSPGWTTTGSDFLNPVNHFFLLANILVVVFSVIALFRLQEMIWFWLSIIFFTIVKVEAMPLIPNHLMLTLIVHLTLFVSVWYWDSTLTTKKERISNWFSKILPYLRIELLIVYFFVVIHKLNYDFFNPQVSCASELYNDIASLYFFIPQDLWIDKAVIVFTLLPEILIPILLIIPATRLIGIFIGLIFHFMLSLHPNLFILSFSAEVYALYILFLPDAIIVQYTKILKQKISEINIKKVVVILTGALLFLLIAFIGIKLIMRGSFSISGLKEDLLGYIMLCWLLWNLFLIIVAFFIFRGRFISAPPENTAFFKLSWSPLLLLLLLTFFNGINPYIGLKTATNFAMFSNLRVEGDKNNHLFMPTKFQVSDKQGDTVTITESNHPFFQDYIDWNERITYFELSRFLYENRSEDIEVTFIRNNNEQTIRLPQQQPDDYLESSWFERKFLIFRGLPAEGPTPCQW